MGDKPDFFEREGEKLKERDELKIHEFPAQPLVMTMPDWCIVFNSEVGDRVGELSFDSQGQLEFEGETDRSAEIFFKCVVRANNQELEDMRELAKLGYAVVQDFLPNVANCALQDYGALNDFMIKAKEEFGD